MAKSRRELADAYEAQDLIIQAAQEAKRTATMDYRQFLDERGMDKDAIKNEVDGFKKAFRRKMDGKKKGTEAVEHVDAIADEIYIEITSPAPRATRVASDVPDESTTPIASVPAGFDLETGEEVTTPEITEPQPQAASDLTVSHALNGQVATIQPETAAPAHSPAATPADANAGGENVAASLDTETIEKRTDLSDAGKTEAASAPSAPVAPLVFTPRKTLRPLCQKRDRCGASGPKECYSCLKAAAQAGAA